MVEASPGLVFDEGEQTKGKAAIYLQEIVNNHARRGWEFFRVDTISKTIHPGCLGWLLGARTVARVYYVITFRRLVAA